MCINNEGAPQGIGKIRARVVEKNRYNNFDAPPEFSSFVINVRPSSSSPSARGDIEDEGKASLCVMLLARFDDRQQSETKRRYQWKKKKKKKYRRM